MSDSSLTPQVIEFPNGHRAMLLAVQPDTDAATIVAALNVPVPRALIVLVGGAGGFDKLDATSKSRLQQLFSRGIARAAAEIEAVIIDGGTGVGTMAMMGQGVADRGYESPLIGFAPANKVSFPGGLAEGDIPDSAPLDQNHSHFVLVQGENWGDEIPVLSAVARQLGNQIPVVTFVVNGGEVSKATLLQSVRNHWPIYVIKGSGRLADDIVAYLEAREPEKKGLDQFRKVEHKVPFIADPVMAEIIADGKFCFFSINSAPEELELTISREVGNPTLKNAWSRFALYDYNAKIYQKDFRMLQQAILLLGVLATTLALAATQFKSDFMPDVLTLPILLWSIRFTIHDIAHLPIILLPITISALVAYSSRFNPGSKYTMLRAAAERVKRDIFAYRTRAGLYSDEQLAGQSREALLQQRVEELGRQLMQTDLKEIALHPYEGPIPPRMFGATAGDDGFSVLKPNRYDEIRLGDQIEFHRLKVIKLGKTLKYYQRMIYVFGAAGTFLAAIGFELWIALTTALASIVTAYLQYEQVEYTLTRNNQTLIELQNVRAWWRSLPPAERIQKNVDLLVDAVEKTLDDQLSGWVKEMSQALAAARAEQAKKETQ